MKKEKLIGKYMLSYHYDGDFRFIAIFISEKKFRIIKYREYHSSISSFDMVGYEGWFHNWNSSPYKILKDKDDLMVEML